MDFSVLDMNTQIALVLLAIFLVAVFFSIIWLIYLTIRLNRIAKKDDLVYEDDNLFAEVAYFHEKGNRKRQEDAIYVSPLDEYVDYGIFACVADGIGGLKHGYEVSKKLVDDIEDVFPVDFDNYEYISDKIERISTSAFNKYQRRAGSTLALAHVYRNKLHFYSVGDSNIILIRDNEVTVLNHKQNYAHTMVKELSAQGLTTEVLHSTKKGRELTDFIGNVNPRVLCNCDPIKLLDGDTILITSDGVTDTINSDMIGYFMHSTAKTTAENIKLAIRRENKLRQDNYSAIVIRFRKYNF